MCVAIASKITLKSGKTNWFLYKIRDRAYSPKYKIKYFNSSTFVIDSQNDWTEGVNSDGISIVSVALQNHDDKKDGKHKSSNNKKVSRNGVILRHALKMTKISDVVTFLTDMRFEGSTFVTDGDKLFVLEIFLYQKTKDKILNSLEIDPIEDKDKVKSLLMKNVKPEDYKVKVKEITNESLVVRTNHGIFLKDAGYTEKDGDGYKSSVIRRNTVIKAIEKLEPNHPFEILTCIKNLTAENLNRNTEFCPIREDPSEYLTTSIQMLTPTGTIYIVPMFCSFEETSLNRILKDRDSSVVILPKKIPLFEHKSFYNHIKYGDIC